MRHEHFAAASRAIRRARLAAVRVATKLHLVCLDIETRLYDAAIHGRQREIYEDAIAARRNGAA